MPYENMKKVSWSKDYRTLPKLSLRFPTKGREKDYIKGQAWSPNSITWIGELVLLDPWDNNGFGNLNTGSQAQDISLRFVNSVKDTIVHDEEKEGNALRAVFGGTEKLFKWSYKRRPIFPWGEFLKIRCNIKCGLRSGRMIFLSIHGFPSSQKYTLHYWNVTVCPGEQRLRSVKWPCQSSLMRGPLWYEEKLQAEAEHWPISNHMARHFFGPRDLGLSGHPKHGAA